MRVLVVTCCFLAQQLSAQLLPTAAAATEAARLKALVGDFVIRQLEAYPSIAPHDLRRQLRTVLGSTGDEYKAAPYVFASGAWRPKTATRTWVVVHDVWLGYHGVGGSAVVIDAYVWENGGARLAAERPAEAGCETALSM